MKRLSQTRRETSFESTDGDGTWALSYGDMVTLLLAFFLLFFSVDAQKITDDKLTTSLLAALSPLSQGEGVKAAGVGGTPEVLEESLGRALGATVSRVGQRIILEFPKTSFYASGDTELSPEGQKTLQQFATLYIPYAGQNLLNVVGFADHRPVTPHGRYKDNWELSVLRAVAAQRYLQTSGIPLASTRLGGFGVKKFEPANQENLSEAEILAFARKVVLIIEPARDDGL